MYFKLNKNFTDGSTLNAKLLNSIIFKIIEIGGNLSLELISGGLLLAEDMNKIVSSINEKILSLPNSGISQLELHFLNANSLCASNLNSIVSKINEIIDFLNNYKEDVYELFVKQKSVSTNISSSGGIFVVDAYITKNGKYFSTNGIQITSELNYSWEDRTITFTVSENNNLSLKNFNITISSLYGIKEISLTLEGHSPAPTPDYEIYVGLPQQIVSANGEAVLYTVSIRKDGENYTTLGILSDSSYPYGVSETYTDNGVERVYTVTFDENTSFEPKNYKTNISSYGLEAQEVSIQLEANVAEDIVKVYANYSDYVQYPSDSTYMSFTYYAKVNGEIVTSGITPQIVTNEVDAEFLYISTIDNKVEALYRISRNTTTLDRILSVKATYRGKESKVITLILKGKEATNYSLSVSPKTLYITKDGLNGLCTITFNGTGSWDLYDNENLVGTYSTNTILYAISSNLNIGTYTKTFKVICNEEYYYDSLTYHILEEAFVETLTTTPSITANVGDTISIDIFSNSYELAYSQAKLSYSDPAYNMYVLGDNNGILETSDGTDVVSGAKNIGYFVTPIKELFSYTSVPNKITWTGNAIGIGNVNLTFFSCYGLSQNNIIASTSCNVLVLPKEPVSYRVILSPEVIELNLNGNSGKVRVTLDNWDYKENTLWTINLLDYYTRLTAWYHEYTIEPDSTPGTRTVPVQVTVDGYTFNKLLTIITHSSDDPVGNLHRVTYWDLGDGDSIYDNPDSILLGITNFYSGDDYNSYLWMSESEAKRIALYKGKDRSNYRLTGWNRSPVGINMPDYDFYVTAIWELI